MPTRVTIVVAAGLVMALTLVAIWAVRRWVPDQPLPPSSADVRTVARAYVRAAEHEDCSVTRALTTSHTWAWCSDPRLISVRGMTADTLVTGGVSRPEHCVAFDMTTTGSSDETMPRGAESWGFCFVPTSAGWRLWDQGQG
jgi:hypothetical protein